MRAHEMLPHRKKNEAPCLLVVGFSGGADSVCLLQLLVSIRALLRIRLLAVHVNHGLRGEEAVRDEAFCRAFAEAQDIPYSAVSVDVRGEIARSGASVEEAARTLRYTALFDAARKAAMEKTPFRVATAHHADDQAETILLNLLRGSGLRGLSGMQPVRGALIRPLLAVPKKEILDYLDRHGLSYVTDSSNDSDAYTRNRLRHTVLPLLETLVNSQALRHIGAAGVRCGEADAYLRAEARAWLSAHAGDGETVRILRKDLKEKPQILRRYVIIEALHLLGIPERDFGEAHFEALDRAVFQGNGYHLDLPHGCKAQNEDGFLHIMRERHDH